VAPPPPARYRVWAALFQSPPAARGARPAPRRSRSSLPRERPDTRHVRVLLPPSKPARARTAAPRRPDPLWETLWGRLSTPGGGGEGGGGERTVPNGAARTRPLQHREVPPGGRRAAEQTTGRPAVSGLHVAAARRRCRRPPVAIAPHLQTCLSSAPPFACAHRSTYVDAGPGRVGWLPPRPRAEVPTTCADLVWSGRAVVRSFALLPNRVTPYALREPARLLRSGSAAAPRAQHTDREVAVRGLLCVLSPSLIAFLIRRAGRGAKRCGGRQHRAPGGCRPRRRRGRASGPAGGSPPPAPSPARPAPLPPRAICSTRPSARRPPPCVHCVRRIAEGREGSARGAAQAAVQGGAPCLATARTRSTNLPAARGRL
jgi:hypothetical protein